MSILKRKLRSEVLYQSNFKEIRSREGEIEFFASKYPSFILEVKFPNSSSFNEFGKIAILPIKKKIFSLWAENYQIVQQMVEVILNVEKS